MRFVTLVLAKHLIDDSPARSMLVINGLGPLFTSVNSRLVALDGVRGRAATDLVYHSELTSIGSH